MNQILEISLKKIKDNKNKIINFFKFQFTISIILLISIIIIFIYQKYILYKKEKFSKQLINNYNITKIYSNYSINSYINNNILGIIQIDKINIYYPIFSTYSEELLKISPCRFYGPSPGKLGNLCIAGHNYDNNKFFSNIPNLELNDEIIIFDHLNNKYIYNVTDKYEVATNDMNPIYSYDKKNKELTLITCNNKNNKRIIIKSIIKR